MGLFGKKKHKVIVEVMKPEPEQEHLEKGELPWGWVIRNKDFIEKIQNEYTYFLNKWIDSRKGNSLKQYESLKSFVLYMEDGEKLCKSKGECFEFWFNEILTGKGYLEKRKSELRKLETQIKEGLK